MFVSRLPRTLAIFATLAVLVAPLSTVDAARNTSPVQQGAGPYELVIIEVEGCTYCAVLRRDVMPAYATAPEARDLPVRFLDLNTPEAAKLHLIDGPLTVVPTLLLVKENREVARASGYMGPDGFFYAIRWMMKQAQ
jgi:thioredoxin-related protein